MMVAALLGVGPGSPAIGQTSRDSAGIRIVDNDAPLLSREQWWRVDPRPIVAIGADAASRADTVYEFERIMGVARLRDGRLAVGVQGSHTIRFFDAAGRFAHSAGRQGRGPGEFQQILGLDALRGDTLFVTDLGEVEFFTGAGQFLRSGASRSAGEQFIWPGAVLPDGSYVGLDWNASRAPAAGRRTGTFPLIRVSRDGRRHDTLGDVPGWEQVFDGASQFGRPVVFAPSPSLTATSDRFYHGYGDRFQIAEYTLDGRLRAYIRWAGVRERVADAERDAWRQHAVDAASRDRMHPQPIERIRRSVEQAVFADVYPAFHTVLGDGARNVWVQRYDYREALREYGPSYTHTIGVPTRWDVFDARGTWLCTVDLPARFTPFEIGDDYVAGVARDVDGREQVHVYRLDRMKR
jgi:hypothetical protein